MRVDIIAGARPNFMKISPLIRAIESAQTNGFDIEYRLINTGQHYDKNMSDTFFEELNIPKADIYLEIRSGMQAEQKAGILVG